MSRDLEAAPGSLSGRAARGAAVTLMGQVLRIAVQMAGIAVLARLLGPREYGLVAMVAVVVALGEVFRDFGLSAAAVQSATLSRAQRDNLWWANAGVGTVLCLITVAASGPVATFYGEPQVGPITQALALTFVINGLSAQYRASLTRSMRFSALAGVDVGAQVVGLVVGVWLALSGASFWALVGMQLAQSLAALLLLLGLARWVPGLPKRGQQMSGFWQFGWNLVGSQLLGFLSNNADSIVLGRRLGADQLGVYDRAYRLLVVPLAQVRSPATTVALPVLSSLQDDDLRFGQYLVRGQLALGYSVIAGLGFAAGAATPLINLFLGVQWQQSAPIFAILALAGALQTLAFVGYWVYLSRALTGELLRFSALSSTVRVAAILIGSHWGLFGVAWGVALSQLVLWPISVYWLSRVTTIPRGQLLLSGARTFCLAILAAVAVRGATMGMAHLPDLLQVAAGGVLALAVYGVAALVVPPVRRDVLLVVDVLRRVGPRKPSSD